MTRLFPRNAPRASGSAAHGLKMVKSCIKTGPAIITLLFSLNTVATEITVFPCEAHNRIGYDNYKPVYESDPGNLKKIHSMSIFTLCIGKMDEGLTLLKRASDGGHAHASWMMGIYYEKDRTWDVSKSLTADPENFNAMLFYFERAANQIESIPDYPDGNMFSLERADFISAEVFSSIPHIYYGGYYNALIRILSSSEKVSYTDTLEVLENIAHSAERCLDRPSLSVWEPNRSIIANDMRIRCQALLDFAEQVYPLEQERMNVAEKCTNPVSDCAEHTDVIRKIGNLMHIMYAKYKSVSLLN